MLDFKPAPILPPSLNTAYGRDTVTLISCFFRSSGLTGDQYSFSQLLFGQNQCFIIPLSSSSFCPVCLFDCLCLILIRLSHLYQEEYCMNYQCNVLHKSQVHRTHHFFDRRINFLIRRPNDSLPFSSHHPKLLSHKWCIAQI